MFLAYSVRVPPSRFHMQRAAFGMASDHADSRLTCVIWSDRSRELFQMSDKFVHQLNVLAYDPPQHISGFGHHRIQVDDSRLIICCRPNASICRVSAAARSAAFKICSIGLLNGLSRIWAASAPWRA